MVPVATPSPADLHDPPLLDHAAMDAITKRGDSREVLLKRLDLLMQLGDKVAEVRDSLMGLFDMF